MKYVVWQGVCGSCLTEVLMVLGLGGFESHKRLSMWKCYYTIGLWAINSYIVDVWGGEQD